VKRFAFPLERVLRWRRTQAELEEARLAELMAELARVRREMAALQRELAGGEQALVAAARKGEAMDPRALAALDDFRRYVRRRRDRLRRSEAEIEWRISEQRKAALEARRRAKVLEKYREKRLEEWRLAADQEANRLADELYLAGKARREQRSLLEG